MKKTILLLALCTVHCFCFSQDYQKEIDEQLWVPFLKASSEFDGEAFMSLQSRDLVRIALDPKLIENYDQYAEGIMPNFRRIKSEGKLSRTTEMRFLTRIASVDAAYETGYFKSVTRMANGEFRTRYSQFYMVLRKENGYWKILVDSDTNLNNTITEEMFLAAKPIR